MWSLLNIPTVLLAMKIIKAGPYPILYTRIAKWSYSVVSLFMIMEYTSVPMQYPVNLIVSVCEFTLGGAILELLSPSDVMYAM